MLVTADGRVLIHPQVEWADGQHRLVDLPGFSPAAVDTLTGKRDAFAHTFDASGQDILASSFIPELNAYVIAQVPKAELLDKVKRAAWLGPLLAAVVASAIGAVLVTFIARALVAPIRRAAVLLKDIADGEGDLTRRMEVEGEDEVGELAIAFNRFIESLQTVVGQVRESADQIASATN